MRALRWCVVGLMLTGAVVPAMVIGCGSVARRGRGAAVPGTEVVDWRRPQQMPDWVDHEPGIVGGELQFVGLVDRSTREDLGRTDAREATRITLARDLGSRIQSRYGIGREGSESRFIEEAASLVSDATVRAARAKEWYTEKYHVVPPPGGAIDKYYYKIYVLMAVPLADFQYAKQHALTRLDTVNTDPVGRNVLRRLEADLSRDAWPYDSQ